MTQRSPKLKQDRVTITISKNIWRKLSKLKINKNFGGFNETLEYLMNKAKVK
jgi:hypothetical protein